MRGFVHLYCGDGKGKTTAAVGLSVRASGAGKSVLFMQFLKDGSSSELNVLRALPNVKVLCCERNFGFFPLDGQRDTGGGAAGLYGASGRDAAKKRGRRCAARA